MIAEEESEATRQQSSRRELNPTDWACSDSKCGKINSEKHKECGSCGKAKPKPKNKAGVELGKEGADKSKGLFAAEDWMCTKCGNVNWAKRKSCNTCNAKKLADAEVRTGFGGGYNDRQNVEYVARKDQDEFDEFGRRKKKPNQEDSLMDNQDEEESESEEDDEDLGKYDLTGDPELADVKISIDLSKFKRKAEDKDESGSTRSSDCSCSCSGGECSCEESDEETRVKQRKKESERSRDYRRSPPRNRNNDRYDDRSRRDRDRRRSRDRSYERSRR